MLLRSAAALMLFALTGPCLAAEAAIAVDGPGQPASLTAADIAALPSVSLTIAFDTDHGPRQATFEGPLLWTVLDHVHAVDGAAAPQQVRQIVTLTGRDGYTAALALGEISPAFEAKQVILAEKMDGKALMLEHFRVVVPGDKRGGRSVRDIMQIGVTPLPAATR